MPRFEVDLVGSVYVYARVAVEAPTRDDAEHAAIDLGERGVLLFKDADGILEVRDPDDIDVEGEGVDLYDY